MLKFGQFVSFRNEMTASRERVARTNEYNKFVRETLSKFGVKDVHDLDEEGYDKFVDELKGYRKTRMVQESVGDTEAFRRSCIDDLHRQATRLKMTVAEALGHAGDCYIAGAVLEADRFDGSVAVHVITDIPGRPDGLDENLSRIVQRRFQWGFTFGGLDISVFNRAEPQAGYIKL